MGLCFSKKKPPATPAGGAKKPGKIADDKAKKTAQQPNRAAKPAGEPDAAGKTAVLVVRTKDAAAGGEERKKRPGSQEPAAGEKPLPVVVVPSAPVWQPSSPPHLLSPSPPFPCSPARRGRGQPPWPAIDPG